MTHEIDLKVKSNYRFWTQDTVRFADLDPLNHLNNVTSAVYCEAGRAAFVTHLWPDCINGKGYNWVIATLNLTFLKPVYYPSEISIGTRVLRIGNSSVTVGQGLFAGEMCFTTAESVIVWSDTENEKAVPMPDEMKQVLREFV